MKILTILGARPQFIKAGTVSREITRRCNSGIKINEKIVHTGQHFDDNMSKIFFDEMEIPLPDYNLNINSVSHGKMTGKMLESIEELITKERPDCLLVYGDTNSTLAGAIAATKCGISIAHVEAGLRSNNMSMPEEINRILTDRVSSFLFCPTTTAINNLIAEGVNCWSHTPKISLTGDVMLDGALYYSSKAVKPKAIKNDRYILCTIHRAENTNSIERLKSIFDGLRKLSDSATVIIPLHPRTVKIVNDLNISTKGLQIIEPVGYFNMLWLIKNCVYVITDSGGLQKEAYFFSKPCVTLRDETEWIELVQEGCNILVGASTEKIVETQEIVKAMNSNMSKNLYGDGFAARKIVDEILGF